MNWICGCYSSLGKRACTIVRNRKVGMLSRTNTCSTRIELGCYEDIFFHFAKLRSALRKSVKIYLENSNNFAQILGTKKYYSTVFSKLAKIWLNIVLFISYFEVLKIYLF